MTVLKRDTDHHTYSDYLTWSRDFGDELVDGTAYVREPPSASQSHQQIVVELCRQIANALEDKPCHVYVAPFDVRLPKSNEEDDQVDTVVQPDVLGVREVWLIEPIDRKLSIYQLEAGYYERPTILELKGRTRLTAVPGVTIDWGRALARMS
jgi:Putative restriction endonuclease